MTFGGLTQQGCVSGFNCFAPRLSLESSEHFAVENYVQEPVLIDTMLVWFRDGLFSHILLVFLVEALFQHISIRAQGSCSFRLNSRNHQLRWSQVSVESMSSQLLCVRKIVTNQWKPETKRRHVPAQTLQLIPSESFQSHLFDSAFKEKGNATDSESWKSFSKKNPFTYFEHS